jgi:hypothetical protein
LFPPGDRPADDKGKEKEVLSLSEHAKEVAATDLQRDEIRQYVREQMERGQLSGEPELEDHNIQTAKQRVTVEAENVNNPKLVGRKTEAGGRNGPKRVPEIQEDEFFGEESDEDADEKGDEMDED